MKRSVNADLIKCISIFGVVFIHGAFILEESTRLDIFRDIFRFAVPCFIILWAFFFEISYSKKSKIEKKKYVLTRFIHLFRVYFLWSLLYFFITVDWNNFKLKDIVTKYFSGYGWSGQYFFIILFQLLIFYPVLLKIYERRLLKIITIILIIVIYVLYGYFYEVLPNIIVKVGERPFFFWIPYVFLGIALARKSITKISYLYILAPIFITIEFIILNKLKLQHSPYITIGVLMASGLFCIALLYFRTIEIPQKLEKMIEFIGNNTLIIFVSNPLLILIIEKILSLNGIEHSAITLPSFVKVLISLIIFVLIFIGTLGIVKLLDKTKLKNILG